MYKNIILPASILAGTIIGAGFFALPYLFVKTGLAVGLFYVLIFAGVFILMHLLYTDIVLRTNGTHRLAGYASRYTGKFGELIALCITIFGSILASTIYLILSISFFNLLIPGINPTHSLLIFWALSSFSVFFGIKRLSVAEFFSTYGIAAIILIIFAYGLEGAGRISTAPAATLNTFFLPYGAILFSLSGRIAVTALIDYFKKRAGSGTKEPVRIIKNAKRAIIIGTLFPACIYALFVFAIISLSPIVSEDSVSGLIGSLPYYMLWLLGALGLIAMWSTYIAMIYDVSKSLRFDLKFPDLPAKILVVFTPLLLYFAGLKNFIGLVSFVGGIFISVESFLIILIWSRLPKPRHLSIFKSLNRFVLYGLLIIFVLGIITTLFPS